MKVCTKGNWLIQVSALFILLCQNNYISNVKEAVEMQQKAFSTKIKTKMPTRTKNAEMNQIVTNLEIHLHHFLCEFKVFKTGRSSHRRRSIKKVQASVRQLIAFDQLKAMYGCCQFPPTTVQLWNGILIRHTDQRGKDLQTKAWIFFFFKKKQVFSCFMTVTLLRARLLLNRLDGQKN